MKGFLFIASAFSLGQAVIYFPIARKLMHHKSTQIGPSFFSYGHNGYLVPMELLTEMNDGNSLSNSSKFYSQIFLESIVKRNITWIAMVKCSDCFGCLEEEIFQLQNMGASAVVIARDDFPNFPRKSFPFSCSSSQKNTSKYSIDIPSTFISMHDYEVVLLLTERFKSEGFMYAAIDATGRSFEPNLTTFSLVVGIGAMILCCYLMYHLWGCLCLVENHYPPYKIIHSTKDLEAFPQSIYVKGQRLMPDYGQDRCSICLDDYESGVCIRKLPCDHAYHAECIDAWLMKMSILCPLCKRDVTAIGKMNKSTCI